MFFQRRRRLTSNPFFSSSSFELGSAKKKLTNAEKRKLKDKANAQSDLLPKHKAQGRRASLSAVQHCTDPTTDWGSGTDAKRR